MRRLMAKEAEDAKARGEIIEETSASDWSSADDDNPGESQGILCNNFLTDFFRQIEIVFSKFNFIYIFPPPSAEEPDPKVQDEEVQQDAGEEKPKDQSNAKKRVGDDTGHDADMDDTSMSSRASSRMLESINVMSMDSMNVMYDSEYDDLRLASASAGNIVNLKKKRKSIKKRISDFFFF